MALELRDIAIRAEQFGSAFAKAGIHETGFNRGDQIEYWQRLGLGLPGQSYCQYAAYAWQEKAYCAVKGYLTGATDHDNRLIMLKHADEMSTRTGILRTGSCADSLAAAKQHGRYLPPTATPGVGDQVYFDMPVNGHRLGHAHHTGLVRRVLPNGDIETVEANTSAGESGSQDNGQGVYVRVRSTQYVVGYMHLTGIV